MAGHTYLREAPRVSIQAPSTRDRRPTLKDSRHRQRENDSATQAIRAKLPRLLPLPRARIHRSHQEDDVRRRRDVEDFEQEQPRIREAVEWRRPQQIEVACAED